MCRTSRIVFMFGLVAGGLLSGCSDDSDVVTKIEPAIVDEIAGSELKRVTLTQDASDRVGVETGVVAAAAEAAQTILPYAAVVYDAAGDTWTYVNPEPLVFLRQRIVIENIDGDIATLSEGPAVDTKVVVVGAAELFGAETGIGK